MKNRDNKLVLLTVIIALISIGIAFAAFSTTLTINGNAKVEAMDFKIVFEGIENEKDIGTPVIIGSASEVTHPEISDTQTEINKYRVILKSPGDSITYNFQIHNKGTFPADIKELTINDNIGLMSGSKDEKITKTLNNIEYRFYYTDDNTLVGQNAKRDCLSPNEEENVTLKITFKNTSDPEVLPKSDLVLDNLGVKIDYIQTDMCEGTIAPIEEITTLMMPRYITQSNGTRKETSERAYWKYGKSIEQVNFNTNIDTSNINIANNCGTNSNELCSWDVSNNQDGSVMSYLETNENGLYNLYIMSNGTTYAPEDTYAFFNDFTNLKSINGIENLNTDYSYDMRKMFRNCSKITSLDLSNFNTSNVTNMIGMFGNCSGLTELDLSNFDTHNVTTFESTFKGCTNLKTFDLSNFNTSSVTNMQSMFEGCSSLEKVDINSFNTNNVTNMKYMFSECSNLKTLDLSNFNTSNVTDMYQMFDECNNLITVDVSHFNTSKVTTMGYMFRGCTSLTTIDLSNFDMSNTTTTTNMLRDTLSLDNIITPKVYPTTTTITLHKALYDIDGNEYKVLDKTSPTETELRLSFD